MIQDDQFHNMRDNINHLLQWKNGNGSPGMEKRFDELKGEVKKLNEEFEDFKLTRAETCYGRKALDKYIETLEKKRNFRIGDIANLIQLAMLFLLLYQVM